MLDLSARDAVFDEIVEELADSRLCLAEQPECFEARVLQVAELYDMGVTNVMGRVARLVAGSARFNHTRKAYVLHELVKRGVGVSQPAHRCF